MERRKGDQESSETDGRSGTRKETGEGREKLSSEGGLLAIERTGGTCGGGHGDEKTREEWGGWKRGREEWRRRLRGRAAARRGAEGGAGRRDRERKRAQGRGKSETEAMSEG